MKQEKGTMIQFIVVIALIVHASCDISNDMSDETVYILSRSKKEYIEFNQKLAK